MKKYSDIKKMVEAPQQAIVIAAIAMTIAVIALMVATNKGRKNGTR